MDKHGVQNVEKYFSHLLHGYISVQFNPSLNEFKDKYQTNPMNFGQLIRKARMDRNLMIKDLSKIIGVTETIVINWEIRGVNPLKKHKKQLDVWIKRIKGIKGNKWIKKM